jgi:4-hydroxybenzoate polyprenyltransferase
MKTARSFHQQFASIKPVLITLYLPFAGVLSVCSVVCYLHLKPEPVLMGVCIGLIFSIYILNCFSDSKEDSINDADKLAFFSKSKLLFKIGIAAMALSTIVLITQGKLTQYHVVLMAVGIAYSYKLIPWYTGSRGIYFVRLKELPLVKNLVVSFFWGASVFIVPIMFSNTPVHVTVSLYALIGALCISTFNNTVFNDIRDVVGDTIANAHTLPTLLGIKKTVALIAVIDCLWILLFCGLLVTGAITLKHFVLLGILALYPIAYIGLNYAGMLSLKIAVYASELDLVIFAGGLAIISVV